MTLRRCEWSSSDPIYIKYHDEEWGVPLHSDRKIFEFIVLDSMQAGLSWLTVLKKRENYRRAFDGFDPKKISGFGRRKVEALMIDPGIIRNRMKINATIRNAEAFDRIAGEFGSFDKYIWGFVGGKTITNKYASLSRIPATSRESDAMSKDLKKRGFSFVGSTICYAFMQAAGLVNDHATYCFRYSQVKRLSQRAR